MLRQRIERWARRSPGIARMLGERPELQLPAWGFSLVVHVLALLALALVVHEARDDGHREFESAELSGPLPDLDRVEIQDIDLTGEMTTVESASAAPEIGPLLEAAPVLSSAIAPSGAGPARAAPAVAAAIEVRRPDAIALPPMGAELSRTMAIRGSGAEHVGDVEGAVDRVAVELMRRLEQQGRTLVVWALDASGSLQAERERLAKHVEGVYAHVAQLDGDGLSRDGGLLTTVVAFGHDRKALLERPTDDPAAVVSAIREVPLDDTGIESTFGTVAEIARRWGRFKDGGGRPYGVVTIVVTDEVGDDEPRLEEAVAAAKGARMPVYVLGSSALFGRVEGYMDYTDPKTKQFFPRLPVRLGPESAALESIVLPFWYAGPQHDMLDSGFGPYALSRLAGETGGVYFVTRLGPGRVTFDPDRMREYRPDWVRQDRYEAEVNKHPVRLAVIQAAGLTRARVGRQPDLVFPPVDGPEFKDAMTKGQEQVALTELVVNAALEPITAAARHRDRETSRRWQAHFDLIRGRLLAVKIRCYEYQQACASMKRDPMKFSKPASNAWRLVPDESIQGGDKVQAAADEATRLLRKVVEEHPGTPWAVLAARELKDPFGFRWSEFTLPPRPRRDPGDAPARKNAMPRAAARPAEPPKI